jgi:threonine/homoserine/homoserine lactone efflux protein
MTVRFTNPKGLIIFTAIVPDFINRSQGRTACSCCRSG